MRVRMKKRYIGLLLGICLLLGACGQREPGEQTQETESTKAYAQTEAAVREAAYTELPAEDCYYQYGNMQINIPSGNFMRLGNEVIFEVPQERWLLYAYGLDTGEVSLFCKDPECPHFSAGCAAIDRTFGNLEQYDGSIYVKNRGSSVMELVEGKWQTRVRNVSTFWHSYGDLFVVTADWELQIFDGGIGEPRTIMEDYDYYWNVVFGQYLYGAYSETLTRLDLLSDSSTPEVILENMYAMVEGNHIYCVDTRYKDNGNAEGTFYLYRCDMNGENQELLLDKPVLPASLNFDDEYIYFRLLTEQKLKNTEDSRDIYRMSKADPTQIEKIATLPESAYQIFTVPGTGLLFVTTCSDQVNGVNYYEIYVMNTDGSNLRMLELPQPSQTPYE